MGADVYVTKPFSTRDLMAKINDLLARAPRPDARVRPDCACCIAIMRRAAQRSCKFRVSGRWDSMGGAGQKGARVRGGNACASSTIHVDDIELREAAMADVKGQQGLHRRRVDQEHRHGRAEGHLRLLARHRIRVVRLLSLRSAGAVLRGAVLPSGQPDGGAALGLRGLRRGLPGAAVRRAGVRPHRRPRRTEIHLPGHDRVHGRLDLPRRPAADLRVDRLARADPDGDAAPRAGPRARRRVRRRGDLRGRARAAQPARLRHELDPDHRHARPLPRAGRDLSVPQQHGRQGRSPNGAGAFRSGCR